MQELVTVEQAERAIRLMAVVFPSAGLAIGAIVGAVRRAILRHAIAGLLIGFFGPAVWLLWRMYNGIIRAYGLDSVRGLLINLILFVAVGLVIGVAAGVLWRRLLGPARAR